MPGPIGEAESNPNPLTGKGRKLPANDFVPIDHALPAAPDTALNILVKQKTKCSHRLAGLAGARHGSVDLG